MRCCLVVTTYERPDALACVLGSVARQARRPDEVVIADDGSGPATAEVVREFAARSRSVVRHVTQPHEGFRAGRIRNAAIASSDCDYVLLVDGDMLLDPRFVADHVALARAGHYSQGVRILLDDDATRRQLALPAELPGPLAPGLGGLRRGYALHAPQVAARLRRVANSFVAIKSCNQGFWRKDLVAANGFDESIRGWGSEDRNSVRGSRTPACDASRWYLPRLRITWPTRLRHVIRPTRIVPGGGLRCVPGAPAARPESTATTPAEHRGFPVWPPARGVAIRTAPSPHLATTRRS